MEKETTIQRNPSSAECPTRKSSKSTLTYAGVIQLLDRVTRGCCRWLETSDIYATSTQDSFCKSLLCRKLELTSFRKEEEQSLKVSSIAIYISLPTTDILSISDLHVRVVVSSSEPITQLASLWKKLLSTTTIGGKGCSLYLTVDIKMPVQA